MLHFPLLNFSLLFVCCVYVCVIFVVKKALPSLMAQSAPLPANRGTLGIWKRPASIQAPTLSFLSLFSLSLLS